MSWWCLSWGGRQHHTYVLICSYSANSLNECSCLPTSVITNRWVVSLSGAKNISSAISVQTTSSGFWCLHVLYFCWCTCHEFISWYRGASWLRVSRWCGSSNYFCFGSSNTNTYHGFIPLTTTLLRLSAEHIGTFGYLHDRPTHLSFPPTLSTVANNHDVLPYTKVTVIYSISLLKGSKAACLQCL